MLRTLAEISSGDAMMAQKLNCRGDADQWTPTTLGLMCHRYLCFECTNLCPRLQLGLAKLPGRRGSKKKTRIIPACEGSRGASDVSCALVVWTRPVLCAGTWPWELRSPPGAAYCANSELMSMFVSTPAQLVSSGPMRQLLPRL
jgi:hypothetical protein